MSVKAPAAAGRVLPTLNEDGTRNWLRPKLSTGRWWHRRRVVAYVLMVAFIAIPHLQINGKPAILLDVPRREFTLFGTTFLPTDTLLLMLLLASLVLTVFLFSALFGRVWCGWGCPQTIYLEFLFRPIERLVEGGRSGSLRLDRANQHFHPRRLLKYTIYLALSLLLAHTFLAYFVGIDALAEWVRLSPREHPVPFLVMAVTTGLVFTDFTWFREQTCLIACPYGRWQSALLDRQSLVVAYDYQRGEPRSRGKIRGADAGDCIDCAACVTTCPTGIDIRNGLQMECVHCTQCIDACDGIMAQVGKPTGLIRYATQDTLAGKAKKLLRPRVIIYPLVLALFLGAFITALGTRSSADITLLRSPGEPFQIEADGQVANQIRVRIANRSQQARVYTIAIAGAEAGTVIVPEGALSIEAGELRTTSLFILLPRQAFVAGRRDITVRISDDQGLDERLPFNLLGPTDSTRGLEP
ncbi:MAG: cytochrome c oxidase accessory protein CcoG [Gemmatimonadales bacterium]